MEGLGIDPKILIGDIITFVILLIVLKKYAYKPFLAVLEKRRSMIEEGVQKSQDAEKSLQKIRTLAEEVKAAQEKRAKEVMVAAEAKAQEKTKIILAGAEDEKAKIIETAKKAMDQERVAARERQEREAVDLAIALAEKVLQEKITKEGDRKLIEKIAAGIK